MGIFGHPKESKTDDLYEYGYGNESWTCCCATHKFSLGVEVPSEKLFTPNYWKNPPPLWATRLDVAQLWSWQGMWWSDLLAEGWHQQGEQSSRWRDLLHKAREGSDVLHDARGGETFSMYQRDYTEGIPQVVVSKRRSNSACWTSQLRRKLPLQSRTSLWQEGKALSECWGKAGYEPKKRPSCTHTTSCCLSGQHRPLVCLQREQREVKIPWMQGHDQGQVHEMWSFFSVSPVRRTTFLISTHSKAEMVLVLVKWDILVVLMLVSQETKRGFAECALW